ncbi:MAG: glycosyltransferase family 2 protein [Desulfobacula sp.]|nr:glycosyltransferase family 2 protein [Desulfobacula sp.]
MRGNIMYSNEIKKNQKITISIIVPTYNVEPYIKKTLESVIHQACKDYELIIIDDGSTDNTVNVIQSIVQNFDAGNIHLIRKDNGGVSSSRNMGLSMARGDYILFLDGDDYISENCVQVLSEYIQKTRTDILCYGFDQVDENHDVLRHYFDKYNFPEVSMTGVQILITRKEAMFFQTWTGSVVYSKKLLVRNSLQYTEGCDCGQDSEFLAKALMCASKVSFINKVLSYYLIREGSKTNCYNIDRFQVIFARQRSLEYARLRMDKKSLRVFEAEFNCNIIRRFLFIFVSCMEYKIQQSKIKREAFKILYDDINTHFPSLWNEMNQRMKRYNGKGRDKKLFIKCKLFRISPFLYYVLFKLKKYLQFYF